MGISRIDQVREGSVIIVRGRWGSDDAIRATVTGVEEDIKNGYPGVCYYITDPNSLHWAYFDQVDSVVTY